MKDTIDKRVAFIEAVLRKDITDDDISLHGKDLLKAREQISELYIKNKATMSFYESAINARNTWLQSYLEEVLKQ